MGIRIIGFMIATMVALALASPAAGQTGREGSRPGTPDTTTEEMIANAEAAKPGPVPRTPDGKPDFRGTWRPMSPNSGSNELEERPRSFGTEGGGPSLVADPPD